MNMKFTKEKEEQLVRLMEEYHASDLDELLDILPDLDLEDDYEDELPQLPQQEVDEDAYLNYIKPVGDVSDPYGR